ncbi:MAG: Rid family hydrolase [Thermoanaerobaculia bacterium]
MRKKANVFTNALPSMGTYAQALRAGDFVFTTAQTGRSYETGGLVEGLEGQTRRMLANIDAVLAAAGCSRGDIVKVTLALADIRDFKAVDQIYGQWLPGRDKSPYPARTPFQAAALPAGAKVMMEVIALIPEVQT